MATPKTLKAIDASLVLLAIAGLLTGGIGCGGGDNLQEFDDAHIKPADPGAHDHHHHHHDEEHKAPHGGTLVALGTKRPRPLLSMCSPAKQRNRYRSPLKR